MGQPQQPEQRRSGHGGTTQEAAKEAARTGQTRTSKGRPHGSDKTDRTVPPDQRPEHPA
jgi:hypothetical protein